ncbi:BspA family leucine-rich repeat surface protein [Chryseobacterium sp. ES2]|uniref:BspA family leucine-rich repeat surface protein n=1 Tax=Chryseobacterium metallicongregator TaxID=3073042 RepID=A0ABU1E4F8_9FLAO|nr:BspA family leucine-rich repeat surface protein [Chryseobacterium sp. ES2]MDR4952704.1 BspA family leucine-rich repeat surface protein [Chryseobacterium sp. ES2]
MVLKRFLVGFFILLAFIVKAQNEFITIWKPASTVVQPITVSAPYQASTQQIWFPGIGENYDIYWEEVDYPQHNGSLTNITSTKQVLIDFGTSIAEKNDAKYRVKVSNGNGIFQHIKFGDAQEVQLPDQIFPVWQINGSADKILEIEQWGNITWTTMNSAFSQCKLVQLTAPDIPDLSNVEDASYMFYGAKTFTGASSMQNWDTSRIKKFRFMFAIIFDSINNSLPDQFNPPYFNSWNMSLATDLSFMFAGRGIFNQTLNNWDVSNVTDMKWMFALCPNYNQPMDNWDTSNLEDIRFMFHFDSGFNQSLNNWNTSKITNMAHAIHGCTAFNHSLENWDMTKVTKIDQILKETPNFNQSLASWNLASVNNGAQALMQTGMDCENFSKTLAAWADNPNTANNVDLDIVTPLAYASNAADKRNILISKGWTMSGDTVGNCLLSSSDVKLNKKLSLYPNPAVDDIHIEGLSDIKKYRIFDASGRLVLEGNPNKDMINVGSLPKGNYILQLILKDTTLSSKFIKK